MPKCLLNVKKIKKEDIYKKEGCYIVLYGDNSQHKTDTKYLIVCESEEPGNETLVSTDEYRIIGSTLIFRSDVSGELMLQNEKQLQKYGVARSLAERFTIDSYATAIVNGKEQTIIRYTEEIWPNNGDKSKKYKFVRLIDDEGNLYIKPKGVRIQIVKNEELTV